MPVTIRCAMAADSGEVGALNVRAWQAAYVGILPDSLLAALSADKKAQAWAEYVATIPDDDRLWVLDDAGIVSAYCRTGPAGPWDADLGPHAAEVLGLYVDPARIGTGLGRRLFGHAVDDLLCRGFAPVCVYAYGQNSRAIRFYQAAGFRLDGRTRLDVDDGTGVTEVRLARAAAFR